MKLLVHCCCGPCAAGSLPQLQAAGYKDLLCWFFNPNIQPWQEHVARRESFRQLMESRRLPYLIDNTYPLEQWLQAVAAAPEQRCRYCYEVRLAEAARQAQANDCEAFTTTLLISPYQDHQMLRELGEYYAVQCGVAFLYQDLRPGFRAGQQNARQMGLYMQKYCGCIYSEKQRYEKQIKGSGS